MWEREREREGEGGLRLAVRRDGEGAAGQQGWKAPVGALSTATCHKQPQSHLFPVTLNKMLATPVGPM